jgi:transcriptional regulator with XRE-family HTH domain
MNNTACGEDMTQLPKTMQEGIIWLKNHTNQIDFPMTETTSFAQRLKTLRKEHNLSQTDLGKRVGVHYTHVGRYESGRAKPNAETLQKLAACLGVTADFLIEGSTNETAAERLTDKELLSLFEQVEDLGASDKQIVKRLLEAFLTMGKITEMTRKAG